jgi:uncharacterized coiled-coil DUF342 family protein
MAPSGPPAKADAKAKAKPEAKPKPKAKAKAEKDETEQHVPKPDKDAMEAATKVITDAIEALKAKKKELDDKMNSGKGVKDEFFKKKGDLSAKIGGFKEKIDALHAELDKHKQGVDDAKNSKQAAVQEVKKMKASIGWKNEEEMDNRMREIEYSLQVDTLPLKKEKELLKELSELKKNRPKIAQVNAKEEGIKGLDISGNKETVQEIKAAIREWMQQKAKVVEERNELENEFKKTQGDDNIYEEKNKLQEKIKEKMEERQKIRDAFREEEKKFWEAMKKKREEQQERYAAEREARNKEWEERQRQRKVEKMDEQPYVQDITLIEQTIKFCKSLTSGKEEKKEEEAKEIDHKNMDGLQVLGKKDERDEFWFEPTKGKKNKGSKQKAAPSAKPIKHNAETFKLFDQLKLDAPLTVDQIPDLLEKLEAKLVVFQEKVAKWEATKEEKKAKILAGDDAEEEKEDDKAEPKEEEKEEKEEEEKAEEKEDE